MPELQSKHRASDFHTLGASKSEAQVLRGRVRESIHMGTFLILEDEPLIVLMVADMLEELGHIVFAVAPDIAEGMRLAEAGAFDVAILDVNVRGQQSFPVADIVLHRGLPVIFATGYGEAGRHQRFENVPVLAKPFSIEKLALAISSCSRTGPPE